MVTYVIPTTSADHIGKKLIGEQGLEIIFPDKNKEGKRHFPGDEVYERISSINRLEGRVVLLHSGAPNPNGGLMELKQLLWILNGANVHPIEAFFTCFPYGRQDNVFQIGETNVAENLIRELIEYYHVSRLYTIDAHFYGKRDWVNKYPIINISAVDSLKQRASKDYPSAIYLAPDTGSQLRTGLKGTEKKRKDSYAVEVQSDEYFRKTVKNQTIGAIDDLLLTGGTLDRFHDECMKYGAKEVIALITHGVLPEAIARIKSKYSKLYLTNSINNEEANVDITDLVLDTIRKHEAIILQK